MWASPLLILVACFLLCGCPGESQKEFKDQGTWNPDAAVTGDGTFTGGGACPCKTGMACIASVCRLKCTIKPCNAPSGCSADESCLSQGAAKTAVCMPGKAKGEPCDTATPCKGGLICLSTSTSGGNARCYHTCSTAGTTCAAGGKCFNTPSGTCQYCYP